VVSFLIIDKTDFPAVGLCGLPPIEQKTLDGWGTVTSPVSRLLHWETKAFLLLMWSDPTLSAIRLRNGWGTVTSKLGRDALSEYKKQRRGRVSNLSRARLT
jgi:hypothetical protein